MSPTQFVRDPKFAQDPWLGSTTPQPDAAVALKTGADALTGDIVLLPSGLDVYMSYVDNFGGWGQLVDRFGKTDASLVSITIFGGAAQCADVEPGAMQDGDIGHWLDNMALRPDGKLPWVYTNAGNASTVNEAIGDREVIRWWAHVGFGPHICGPNTCGFPQADWTQWIFTGPEGQNFDRSVGLFVPQPPVPPDPNGYNRFKGPFTTPFGLLHERVTVVRYDGARKHPILYRRYLKQLEAQLRYLADRVWTVAHEQKNPDGKPSWDRFYRGWRFQQLIKRANGQQLVK